mgnify:CR=1 FL=1
MVCFMRIRTVVLSFVSAVGLAGLALSPAAAEPAPTITYDSAGDGFAEGVPSPTSPEAAWRYLGSEKLKVGDK